MINTAGIAHNNSTGDLSLLLIPCKGKQMARPRVPDRNQSVCQSTPIARSLTFVKLKSLISFSVGEKQAAGSAVQRCSVVELRRHLQAIALRLVVIYPKLRFFPCQNI